MSNIPSKADVAASNAANAASNAAAQAKAAEDAGVKYYTDNIVAAIGRGEKSFHDRTGNCSGEVLRRLQVAFAAQGWTVTASNQRTGCTVYWS